jgi:hypothetical protein
MQNRDALTNADRAKSSAKHFFRVWLGQKRDGFHILEQPPQMLRCRIEDVAQFFAERRLGKGFGQEVHAGIKPALMHDGVARIRRGEQHLEVWSAVSRFLSQLPAIHAAGQADVGEKQCDLGVGVEYFKSSGSTCRLQHVIAEFAQGLA